MNITLECEATGRGTIKYSWERHHAGNWTTISAVSTKSYTATTSGFYRCKASNEAGSNVSNRARVVCCGLTCYHVMTPLHAGPPTIMIQPASQLATIGMTITLSCEGTGRGILTYNWEEREQGNRWNAINGSNNTTLTIRNIQNSTRFRCTVSNEAGGTRSRPASITILGKR